MKRYLTIGAAAVALAIPAAAMAAGTPTAGSLAAQSCKTQLTTLGAATFKSTYGGGANAYGKCVSKATHTASTELQSASAACKTEQAMSDTDFATAHDGKTFNATYGTNTQAKGKNAGANAFGKCVSTKAKASAQQQTKTTIAAAKTCKAELAASKTAFATAYGSKANAFGKCVSKKTTSA
jgi:hypothetical protein